MKKRIKVMNDVTLVSKRGLRGPILVPFEEDVATIGRMIISDKAKVVEVLDNGSEVELNVSNFKVFFNRKSKTPATIGETAPEVKETKAVKKEVKKEKTVATKKTTEKKTTSKTKKKGDNK